MSTPNWVDLRRPRDLGALLADGFRTYFRNFGTFIAISAAVVIPVQLILSGVGLKQLWAHYDKTPSVAALLLPTVVNALITTPLVTAMTIYALLDLGEGRKPRAREAILRGLEVFGALLPVVVLAAIGIALGFIAFVIPGIFLAIRWYFVPQAVVVEGLRSTAALDRSWKLVRGDGWRVLGVLIIVSLAIGSATSALQRPFIAAADGANLAVIQLVGVIITQMLAVPAAAVIGVLLYFDVRTRKEMGAAPSSGWGYPQWPQGQQPPPPTEPWQPQPQQNLPAQQPKPDEPPGPAPESPKPPDPGG